MINIYLQASGKTLMLAMLFLEIWYYWPSELLFQQTAESIMVVTVMRATLVDCYISTGQIDVDQAALTGESLPVTMVNQRCFILLYSL